MDWDKLRIFYAVAQAGSFTRAGEMLGLQQSSVSRQISTLEESLGIQLFQRHARGLVLTEQGEMLHHTAESIFAQLSQVEAKLTDTKDVAAGPLQITMPGFLGVTWLAKHIGAFHDEHPDIAITFLLDDRVLNLGMREADAAIRLYKPEQQDLIQRQVTNLHFSICASKDYLQKRGTPKEFADLRNHRLVTLPAHGLNAPFKDHAWLTHKLKIADEGQNPNLVRITTLTGVSYAISAGLGIGLLPDYLIRENKNLVTLFPEEKPDPVAVYFVYPEGRKNARRITLFRDFLLKTAQTLA
ncbi:MAG: LysR family transcriptional regulator [Alphaproteobacteria bacterium]|nr:LysR family transcriptional regulator [Alphaproteobacteria bacterium]